MIFWQDLYSLILMSYSVIELNLPYSLMEVQRTTISNRRTSPRKLQPLPTPRSLLTSLIWKWGWIASRNWPTRAEMRHSIKDCFVMACVLQPKHETMQPQLWNSVFMVYPLQFTQTFDPKLALKQELFRACFLMSHASNKENHMFFLYQDFAYVSWHHAK